MFQTELCSFYFQYEEKYAVVLELAHFADDAVHWVLCGVGQSYKVAELNIFNHESALTLLIVKKKLGFETILLSDASSNLKSLIAFARETPKAIGWDPP